MTYVSLHIDTEEFETEDLIKELVSRGYIVTEDHSTKSLVTLGHVEHLAICGQVEIARAEALQIVSKAIGRNI